VSISAIPAAEQRGEHHDGRERHALRRLGGGDAEQADLGRGVKAQAEQEAERQHVPAPRHQAEHRAEQPRQQPTRVQHLVEVLLDIDLAAPDAAERAVNRAQHHQVDAGDHEQEQRGNAGRDDAADLPELLEAALHRRRGQRDDPGAQGDHGRVPNREPEADRHRALAILHQLAGHVIDCGDMVGVDRVAQAETVGDQRGAEQDRLLMEQRERPNPGGGVGQDQQRIDANGAPAHPGRAVAEQAVEQAGQCWPLRWEWTIVRHGAAKRREAAALTRAAWPGRC